jgi:hypothetical protein
MMRRLSWALAAALLLIPTQASAIPILFWLTPDGPLETDDFSFRFTAGGPLRIDFSAGSNRFALSAGLDGAFDNYGSAFGTNGQRSATGARRGRNSNGFGLGAQNGGWAADFAKASGFDAPGSAISQGANPLISARGRGLFGGSGLGPWTIGDFFPVPVTPVIPAPSITEVPEPVTFAWLFTGLAIAGVGRYRRTRDRAAQT